MIPLDPPGTWCLYAALAQMIRPLQGRRFLEVGCGSGGVAEQLCRQGWRGLGIDRSPLAVEQAGARLASYVQRGEFTAHCGDILGMEPPSASMDLALSLLVLEHVEDETTFVRRMAAWVRPGGAIVVGVPARADCWGIEDETAGHLRRYDRRGLAQVLTATGLEPGPIWSIGVPVVNLLFRVSNLLVKRHESSLLVLSKAERTERSGTRAVPYKTVFPSWFRAILNPVALQPLFWLQRLFYETERGLVLLALARVPAGGVR